MSKKSLTLRLASSVLAAAFLTQCAIPSRTSATGTPLAKSLDQNLGRNFHPSAALRSRILALDPENVSEADVKSTLSQCPAPHMILIHGGINPVQFGMADFSEFLEEMGYPKASVLFPDGSRSFSCYESAKKMTGAVAYYYERDGMRPMLASHSQGGFSIIRILNNLAKNPASNKLRVFNPAAWSYENRTTITDPLTGKNRPVVGLSCSLASPVGAGGITRILPSTWDMVGKLRSVPNSVSEFTAYPKEQDLLGGDFYGYGSSNEYHAKAGSNAHVRNVWLPADYDHAWLVYVKYLALQRDTRAWVNAYRQHGDVLPGHPVFKSKVETRGILWASDIWASVKRWWVKELQTLVRARA